MKKQKGMSKNKRRTNTLMLQAFKGISARNSFTKSFIKNKKK
ncbi:MAG: hypothetical protein Q4A29_03950 [Eubacteriales bacterium]|nr:hypothetical protein [Eubacteriales bacterium]